MCATQCPEYALTPKCIKTALSSYSWLDPIPKKNNNNNERKPVLTVIGIKKKF